MRPSDPDRVPQGPPVTRSAGRGAFVFWAAQSLSQIGDEVYALAIPLVAYAVSRSVSVMTMLYGVSMLPHLAFGVAGGTWADRRGKKVPIISLSIVAACLLSAMASSLAARFLILPALVGGVLLLSVATSALLAAYEGALNEVVPPARRIRVISLLETSRTLAVVAGPILAGFLVAFGRGALPLVVDAGSFLGAAGLMSTVGFATPPPAPAAAAAEPFWQSMKSGLRYAWHARGIRVGMLLSSCNNLALAAFDILVVFRLREGLHSPPFATGLVFAGGGLAALAASLVAPKAAAAAGLRTGMALGLAGIGVAALMLGLAHDAPAIAAAMCVNAFSSVSFNIFWRTYRQNGCDPRLISRVSGACRGLAYCAATAGAWLCGLALANGVPAVWYLVAGGTAVLALGLLAMRVLPAPTRSGAALGDMARP